jgi:MoxR-like ATPase
MKRFSSEEDISISKILKKIDLEKIREQIKEVYIDDNIYEYVRDIVFCTREHKNIQEYLLY